MPQRRSAINKPLNDVFEKCAKPRSGERRRLSWRGRQLAIDARPTRCAVNPDIHRRLYRVGTVQGADPHHHHLAAFFGVGINVCTTLCAEATVHMTAAVRNTGIITQQTFDRKSCSWKQAINRRTSRSDVLAHPTPAQTCDQRRSGDAVTHCAAKTSSCQYHKLTPPSYRWPHHAGSRASTASA